MNPKREKRLQEAARSILAHRTGIHADPVKGEVGWYIEPDGQTATHEEVLAHAFPEGDHLPAYAEFAETPDTLPSAS